MAYENESGYPSPSDILKPWVDTRWFKDEHRERGTNVHNAIKAYFKKLIPIWRPGLEGYRDSFSKIKPIFESAVLIERRLVDPTLCYSGEPDLVGNLSKAGCSALGFEYPTSALLDWKTSKAFYSHWHLRMAAYFHLCEVNNIKCDCHILCRLRSDGTSPKFTVAKKEEIKFYFSYFKAALNTWYFFKVGAAYKQIKK